MQALLSRTREEIQRVYGKPVEAARAPAGQGGLHCVIVQCTVVCRAAASTTTFYL